MPDDKNFVHLHVHTEYSLLDGLSNIKKLVKYAAEAGMPALAISDHGAMFGVIDFYRAAKNAGIKPIIGMEAYLAPRKMTDRDPQFDTKPYHLLLLARDIDGYKNLLKIASASQLHGYYYRPRIDHDFLAAHSKGLIATSGCLAAEIPRMVENGREEEALRMIGWYQDVFGKDNYFLELQHHDIDILHVLNRWLVERSDFAGVPLLATNDVHYVKADDYDAHDTLLCIQTGGLKKEENRFKMTDPSYHLRTPDEMWRLFSEVPEALTNSMLIAEMCHVDLDSKGYHLPVFPVPEGFTAETYLRHLCERGLYWRYGDRADEPEVRARLDYELGIVHNMGFDTYFLIVWDLCEFARHADIWWNVRGSGAGSVAAYTLGITSIEPMSNALLFERFLNPGRVTMPDIDMDFPEDRRAEMIQYCAQKYGEDKVAAIITFGTMGSKAAIRDVGRALDVPLPEVDRIARLIPTAAKAVKFDDALGEDPEKALPDLKKLYEDDDDARRLIDIARALEGVTRHASTHAAGVIISDQPLVEYVPLHRVTGGSEEDAPVKMVTQFPMEICESIGLLKVDFLGLSTLTIMRKACELIERYHGIHYDLSNIPYRPDPETPEINDMLVDSFKMLSRGETIGVFQLESQGMRRMLTDMRPHKFEHIVAAVALYRPGPMDYIPTYNKRLHGEEPVVYHHPQLENILSETYGICVYQEQIMQIGAALFGYSLGEADLMRRAVSKKKKEDLQKHRATFEQRGPEHGVDPETANKIFDDIEFFARYGFNKCLPGDVEVIDAATGRLVRIEDLANGTVSIEHTLTCDTGDLTLKSGHVSAVMDNGVKPVYRLRTWSGNEIEATANHPFYTQEGWRMLGELTGKESIAVAQHIPVEGTKEWNDERLNEVVASLSEEDPNAILPDDAFELTNSQVAKLLARIWETYGQLLAPDNFWDVIFIRSRSKRLIHQLRHLCARLGIWCAANTSIFDGQTHVPYDTLVAAHISGFYAFMEKIAPLVRSERGIAQLQRAGELHTEWEWPRLNNWYRTPGTPVPTNSDFLANDILWDPIYSIDYIGEKQTYDLTVPDTHNFVANDFIVHNSHAADYAVLTCQTAFLKCHYPHEYMTALMSVHRDDSAKVSLFAADCQRLGIQVLPPDVNASLLDFHVEKKPDGTRAIRFGLAAVKNVGVGPLEQIIHCRDEGGPFRDLDDFCHRCDLRIVQKRALESLIRVGALDAFGKRHVLLAILDRMMSFSADYHKAKEAGQMSLFGDSTGVNAEDSLLGHLPDIPDVPYREQLRWEKELVGLYVSSHPLQAVLGHITDLAASGISTTSEIIEAGDEINGRTVQIVGLVTEVRSIITKKGDAMAILNIEDITGTVSAVMFPRTWTEYRKQVAEDVILKITGKADTSRGDVQIVVDAVTQKIEVSQAADALPNLNAMRLDWMDDDPPVSNGNGNGHTPAPEPPRREERAPAPAAQQITDREAPPEDYDYEPEWDSPIVEPIEEHHENGRSTPPPAPAAKTRDQMPTAPIAEPVQYRPRRKSEPKAPPPPPPQGRLLTLIVERTGDSDQDRRRMANLHGYLIQFPGHDHFSFMLTGNNQKRVRIDYPKHPIDINDEMLTYLVRKLGAENVIVE